MTFNFFNYPIGKLWSLYSFIFIFINSGRKIIQISYLFNTANFMMYFNNLFAFTPSPLKVRIHFSMIFKITNNKNQINHINILHFYCFTHLFCNTLWLHSTNSWTNVTKLENYCLIFMREKKHRIFNGSATFICKYNHHCSLFKNSCDEFSWFFFG